MRPKIGGHGRKAGENKFGNRCRYAAYQRIFIVEDIHVDVAIIGVHRGLDGIANVVEPLSIIENSSGGVWMRIAGQVSVYDPYQRPASVITRYGSGSQVMNSASWLKRSGTRCRIIIRLSGVN